MNKNLLNEVLVYIKKNPNFIINKLNIPENLHLPVIKATHEALKELHTIYCCYRCKKSLYKEECLVLDDKDYCFKCGYSKIETITPLWTCNKCTKSFDGFIHAKYLEKPKILLKCYEINNGNIEECDNFGYIYIKFNGHINLQNFDTLCNKCFKEYFKNYSKRNMERLFPNNDHTLCQICFKFYTYTDSNYPSTLQANDCDGEILKNQITCGVESRFCSCKIKIIHNLPNNINKIGHKQITICDHCIEFFFNEGYITIQSVYHYYLGNNNWQLGNI